MPMSKINGNEKAFLCGGDAAAADQLMRCAGIRQRSHPPQKPTLGIKRKLALSLSAGNFQFPLAELVVPIAVAGLASSFREGIAFPRADGVS
jgi:hypothetical protein